MFDVEFGKHHWTGKLASTRNISTGPCSGLCPIDFLINTLYMHSLNEFLNMPLIGNTTDYKY